MDKIWTRKDVESYVKDNIPVKIDPILKGEKAPPAGVTKDILWTLSVNLLRMMYKQQDDRNDGNSGSELGATTEAILKELTVMKQSMAAIPEMIQKAIDDREVSQAKNPHLQRRPRRSTT